MLCCSSNILVDRIFTVHKVVENMKNRNKTSVFMSLRVIFAKDCFSEVKGQHMSADPRASSDHLIHIIDKSGFSHYYFIQHKYRDSV